MMMMMILTSLSIGVFPHRVVRNLYINIQSICIIRQNIFCPLFLSTESPRSLFLSTLFVSDLKNDFVFKTPLLHPRLKYHLLDLKPICFITAIVNTLYLDSGCKEWYVQALNFKAPLLSHLTCNLLGNRSLCVTKFQKCCMKTYLNLIRILFNRHNNWFFQINGSISLIYSTRSYWQLMVSLFLVERCFCWNVFRWSLVNRWNDCCVILSAVVRLFVF